MIKNFIQNIFKKKYETKGSFFNSSKYEMENLICGIGKSEISKDTIMIKNYPFEPSIAYPEKKFKSNEIEGICLDASPNYFKVKNELIFISKEYKTELKEFANRNKIEIFNQTWNWDRILEPFLDTEFNEKEKEITINWLIKNGISKTETKILRSEVYTQMYKYNFDTMLWDWISLGLFDVLSAMRVKYNKNEFIEFYNRAMEIELRKTPHNNRTINLSSI